jgi:hypothetical protein
VRAPGRAAYTGPAMRSARRTAALVLRSALLAALAVTPAAPPVAAECPSPPTPAEALASATIVFVGIVTATSSTRRTATFTVEEIWKGPNLSTETTVYGAAPTASGEPVDARVWTVGTRYLVFPNATVNGDLVADACTATAVYSPSFVALRPTDARAPLGPPTSGPPGAPPFAAAFLLILLAGTGAALVLWRLGPRPRLDDDSGTEE